MSSALLDRIGGAIPTVFSYFAEVLAREKRGEHLSWLCMFWMIGGIYASAMAWAIIPHYGKGPPSLMFPLCSELWLGDSTVLSRCLFFITLRRWKRPFHLSVYGKTVIWFFGPMDDIARPLCYSCIVLPGHPTTAFLLTETPLV